MASLLDEELEMDPALQDWQLMAPDAPISSALRPSQPELPPEPQEPRKLLDVSRGAPAASQPRQDGGGIDALKEAMAQARQNRMGAELGMAGQTIANAFVPTKSSGFWERQLEGADRPVQELQARQKMQGEAEKLKGEGLDRQLRQQTIDMNRLGQEEMGRRREIEVAKLKEDAALRARQNDLNSTETRAAQEALAETPWGKALGPEKIKTLTAADINSGAVLRKNLREPDDALGWARLAQAAQEGALNRMSREEIAVLLQGTKATEATTKADEKEGLLHVPGLSRATAKGTIKPEEAVDFRQGTAEISNVKDSLDAIGAVRTESGLLGRTLPTAEKARLTAMSRGLIASTNKMEKFGALDNGSTEILKEMVPTERDFLDGTFTGKIEELKRNIRSRLRNKARQLGYSFEPGGDYAWVLDGQTKTPPPKGPPKTPPPAATTAALPAIAPPATPVGPVKMRFIDPLTKQETIKLVQPGDVEKMKKFGEVLPNG